ncbi:MAG: T9SS type A sorting domain-containing protein [Candidatus Eisenbacteria bacterium]|uniref:T9SS type A sorting domain-containing protein n=1 Tax=Eiseniibacteriota bacterium TaxID=2212470 RepID=A0A948RXP5_UNCEI|nr:T9SS type A sorting domain-containing protein [Candidatus Eisenbacteria bacterium]MBU1950770.1 T9SS type A sorting domain-containing protein [Candidatus Eisenbacteria bacterium]MBU2690154.1 T9SS type A sorting domain-containing protein [Candidatus Eisenbacteria bacterium]
MSIKRMSCIACALVAMSWALLYSLPAMAEWIPLGTVKTGFQVLDSSSQGITLEYNLEGLEKELVEIDGRDYAQYFIPDMSILMNEGEPQLPVVRQSFIIPDRGAVDVRILSMESVTIETERVVPSKGHIERDIDPADIPYIFGSVYDNAEPYPAGGAAIQEPFILRDFRGAVLEIQPVVYNPALETIEVVTRIELEITPVDGEAVNELIRDEPLRSVDSEFEAIYLNHFPNYEGDRYTAIPEPGRCVIITYDAFYSAAVQLYEWKLQKGIPTILTNLSSIGSTGAQVKSYIQGLYAEPEGITYIILIGDSAQMPTLYGDYQGAASDPCYAKLAGGDQYPDAFVSRISAQTVAQAETQIAKFIRYERDPDLTTPAGNWYTKGAGLASNQTGGTPYTDCQRIGFLSDALLGYTYTSVTEICDPYATIALVAAALNQGCGVFNYIGHGSGTSWSSSGFSVTNVHQLVNGTMNPFIVDVSCSNGTFTLNECLAEAFLRTGSVAEPAGAIAMFSASTSSSWVPPCDMQTEVIRCLTEDVCNSVGALFFSGSMKVMDLYGQSGEGLKLVEQYNIFGDCALTVRSDLPASLTVLHNATIIEDQSTYDVTVPGVEGALAALYDDGVLYGSAYTDPTGLATITLDSAPTAGQTLTLTVTAYNHETRQISVDVDSATLAVLEVDSFTINDLGIRTANGRVEAGENVEVEVVLMNSGIETAYSVEASLLSNNPGITIVDGDASFGDIAPDATGTNDAPFVISVSPDVPDGQRITLSLEISAASGSWNGFVNFKVYCPNVIMSTVHVDDTALGNGDGYLQPGETADILVTLGNNGGGDAAGLNVRLGSTSLSILVTQTQAELEELYSHSTGVLSPPFTVEVSSIIGLGAKDFSLNINGDNGLQKLINFQLYVVDGTPSSVENHWGQRMDKVWLAPVYPNPAPACAKMTFNLPKQGSVDLAVYNAAGRRIATLASGTPDAGIHEIRWDGRDQNGAAVGSGIYFAKLVADGVVLTRQMTVVR